MKSSLEQELEHGGIMMSNILKRILVFFLLFVCITNNFVMEASANNVDTFSADESVASEPLEIIRQLEPYSVEEDIDEAERQIIIDSINQMENLVKMALYNSEYYVAEKQSSEWIYSNSERFWQMLAMCDLPDDGSDRYSGGLLCISEEEAIELTYALIKGFNGILPSNLDSGFMGNGKYYLDLWQPESVKLTLENYSDNPDGYLIANYTYSYDDDEPNPIDGALDVYFEKNSFNNENSILSIPYTICYLTFPKTVNGSRYVSIIPGNLSDNSEYIISDSNTRYLTEEDLVGLSKEQLRLARNEIYARKGRTFKAEDLMSYFNTKSWYKGTVDPDFFSAHETELLNEYEMYNAYFILNYENSEF